MMETKWTPGPLLAEIIKWTKNGTATGFLVTSPHKDREVCGLNAQLSSGKSAILEPEYDPENRCFTPAEAEANAHLFAAAPELYAALDETICHECGISFGKPIPWEGCDSCCSQRAVLKKARGE
jgi:hypothetical protein